MQTQVPLTVKITVDKRSKDAPFVAYTPELDVASCGKTEEKAKKNLFEAVGIVLVKSPFYEDKFLRLF